MNEEPFHPNAICFGGGIISYIPNMEDRGGNLHMDFVSWPGLSFSGVQMLADCNRDWAFLPACDARVCLKPILVS